MNEALMSAIRERVAVDPDFAISLREADSQEAAIAVITAAGIDVPADVLMPRELSDAELSSVSGGTAFCYGN